MRQLLFPTLIVLAVSGGSVLSSAKVETVLGNRELRDAVSGRESLVRVTERPVFVPEVVSMLCRSISVEEERQFDASDSPHGDRWIHVYATAEGEAALREGASGYPAGTILLKEKLLASEGGEPELFTGMIRREAGYNPRCGDWEFFVVSGDAGNVIARGRIESCMDCHREYAGTGFVARDYLAAPVARVNEH